MNISPVSGTASAKKNSELMGSGWEKGIGILPLQVSGVPG